MTSNSLQGVVDKRSVVLDVHSNGIHVQQIYTGLKILEESGYLTCKVVYNNDKIARNTRLGFRSSYSRCVSIQVGDIRICYDMNDNPFITEEFLEDSDFYFKRSYDLKILSRYGEFVKKIFPYGFNYPLYLHHTDWDGLIRTFKVNSLFSALRVSKLYIPFLDHFGFVPRAHCMFAPPEFNQAPKVLFLARLWDPYDAGSRSAEEVMDREIINESRIACMRQLKKEFGDYFLGGLQDSEYTKKIAPDLIVGDKRITSKGSFVNLMRDYPICISTMGLHRSNGWKLGEYIAFSRAIVSEPIHYEVPGNFSANSNYLEFKNPDECTNQVGILFNNRNKREEIMENNWEYYKRFVAPEVLIKNTLEVALSF